MPKPRLHVPAKAPLGLAGNNKSSEPQCPDHLQGVAREHWQSMAEVLRSQGTFCLADGPALELLCRAYADWRRAIDGLQAGIVIKTGEALVVNPYFAAARTCETKMSVLLTKLGLTHIRRGRPERGVPPIAAETPAAADPFEGWELVG